MTPTKVTTSYAHTYKATKREIDIRNIFFIDYMLYSRKHQIEICMWSTQQKSKESKNNVSNCKIFCIYSGVGALINISANLQNTKENNKKNCFNNYIVYHQVFF